MDGNKHSDACSLFKLSASPIMSHQHLTTETTETEHLSHQALCFIPRLYKATHFMSVWPAVGIQFRSVGAKKCVCVCVCVCV